MKRPSGRIAEAKWPPWTSQSTRWPEHAASSRPRVDELRSREADRWPVPPQWIVRFLLPRRRLAVDVELYVDEGRAFVTAVAVRTTVPTDPRGSPEDPWLEGADFAEVSLRPRDLQRLPLATFASAARAMVVDPLGKAGRRRALRAMKRKPSRDRGTEFYAELLEARRSGATPSEIARELGEKPSTVRVWLHRAEKRLGPTDEKGGRS